MEATSTAADLVNPRLTWDAHKPATRPDVFTVDVFELVALRWLSGEEVPKEYQTPIFHETVELARRYLPNLTLRSGCLYHNRTQSGQYVRDEARKRTVRSTFGADGGTLCCEGNSPQVERDRLVAGNPSGRGAAGVHV